MVAKLYYSRLILWQYWLTLFRLLNGLLVFCFGLWALILTGKMYGVASTIHVELWFIVVIWLLVIVNDTYMLTLDMKRGYTYIGCISIQILVSVAAFTMSAVGAIYEARPYPVSSGQILNVLCLLASFGHTILLIFTTISLRARYQVRWTSLWKLDTKDAFLDALKCSQLSSKLPSLMGTPRDIRILHGRIMSITGHGISQTVSRLLFRRISPVETKGYALARNGFALFAIGIIIFRTITVLIWAQNKVATRVSHRVCRGRSPDIYGVQVFAQLGSTGRKGSPQSIDIEVREESSKAIDSCIQEVVLNNRPSSIWPSLLLYTCNSTNFDDLVWFDKQRIYRIMVRSVDGSDLDLNDMPLIWLVDNGENNSYISSGGISPYYTDPWRLNPGYHTEAEARLISRGFISSSIWRDLALNSDPEYTYLSLYPIETLTTRPSQNATIATARLHVTFKSKLKYLRDREAFDAITSDRKEGPYPYTLGENACDFVEDYRSGSILDILGSVGGLFAILQTIHVLLFGRPLFWGLMGTKLINPFGLLSSFGSDGFKRRLHETYGREPTKDHPDCIQTAAFLRDFVIDFGPLQSQPDQRQEQMRVRPVAHRTGTVDSRWPLMSGVRQDNAIETGEEHDPAFPLSPLKMHTRRNSIV